jgi:hypothetical protein
MTEFPISTWFVEAPLKSPRTGIIMVYGLSKEEAYKTAEVLSYTLAHRLQSIEIHHQTKASKRAQWINSSYPFQIGGNNA